MSSKLTELSLEFAENVINACDDIHQRAHIKNQILRSACSIGANIHEAQYAYSRNEFMCKMQIALKECHETLYWLKLLLRTETITSECAHLLINRCNRIRYMLIKTLNTTKSNIQTDN